MGNAKKVLFGKIYLFEWSEDFDSVVPPSIDLYPDAPAGTANARTVDVKITISRRLPDFLPVSINPKIHQCGAGEMRTHMGRVSVSWKRSQDGVLEISAAISPATGLKRAIRKIYSMEFPTEVETFEQLLHELVLVPSVYFSDDTAPIHSAAVARGAGTLLLAGTGGVGKSSAVIAFRKQEDAHFVADDIAVVSANGTVHGNMAWPKIYGYNCAGNEMAHEILKGRGIADRMHFHIRNRQNPARVRRKIAPDRLYRSVLPEGRPLESVFYLFRENVPTMSLSSFPIESAIEMTGAVMESEYGTFHNHLHWEEYNSLGRGGMPMLTMAQVREKWRGIYRSAFRNAKIFKISIPIDIRHEAYQSEIMRIAFREEA